MRVCRGYHLPQSTEIRSVSGPSRLPRPLRGRILVAMSNPPERLAAVLSDRYRIERELGEGGMATVYLAHDLKHERDVALKVLKPELAAMIGGERFVVEIKTTANLQHPHILPLFDSGEAEGFLFYVMPYIEGETLRDRLDREGQIGVDEAIRMTKDVADALDYAHRQGVIHRDIKPENILLQDGRPIVADFGIAVAISAAGGGRMTETGLSLGTPHYMSPEQATAERDLSARSDVYSLACVLYEMLAGDPPHTGPNAQAILIRILTEAPRTVTQIRTSVPPHVSAVLTKALEKLPADRFESAKDFSEALENEGFTYRLRQRTQTVEAAEPVAVTAPAKPLWWRALPWGIAAVAVAVALVGLGGAGGSGGFTEIARLDLELGGIEIFSPSEDVAISPDGTMLAVAGARDGVQGVYLRELDDADWRLVAGTEDGTFPTFSPDNLYLLFRDIESASVVRVSVEGGSALTMAEIDGVNLFQSHWGMEGSIVLNGPQGNFVIPADGGEPIGPLPNTQDAGASFSRTDRECWPDGTTGSSSIPSRPIRRRCSYPMPGIPPTSTRATCSMSRSPVGSSLNPSISARTPSPDPRPACWTRSPRPPDGGATRSRGMERSSTPTVP